jgi:hypothetical protein
MAILQARSLGGSGKAVPASKMTACSVAPQVRKSLAVNTSPIALRRYSLT